MKEFFVDFHCHPTLRALNTPPVNSIKNHWEKTFNNPSVSSIARWARIQTQEISKESQTFFYAYAENNIRVVFDSLYPVEKSWFQFRKMPAYIVNGKGREEIMLTVFGIEKQRLYHLRNQESYFEELKECYQFLVEGQGFSPNKSFNYKLTSDYSQLEHILRNEPDTIAVVVNIEGAHALECGSPCAQKLSLTDHKKLLSDNIAEVKSWKYHPFSIGLAHHFYNQLCGHSRSLKPPINLIFNQDLGVDLGMNDLGWHVTEELLTRKNGPRILLDIKHMSVQSRKEYYNYISRHNSIFPEEKIPIICSHTGVNGFETMSDSIRARDNGRKFKGSYYNNWSINLSDEEIRMIHDSEGMIGLMMDKGLLGGPETLKIIKMIQSPEIRHNAYLKLVLDNMFSIVKAIGKKTAWDIMTVGSDYDGLITHIDGYENASKIPLMKLNLIAFLASSGYRKELWYDMTPQELMSKVFSTNLIQFLSKHFRGK